MLLAASAVLIVAGCDDEVPERPAAMPEPPAAVPERPAAVPEHPAASYVFAGRYQGVESTNQFAVWVVDTYTGAVVRCDTQKCGEWVVPGTPTSGAGTVGDSLREKATQHTGTNK
jgi:hypothetical protein